MSTAKQDALAALTSQARPLMDECDTAMDELEDQCCVPRRSPQMKALRETLAETRNLVAEIAESDDGPKRAVASIEAAGAQLGRLQVTCCAPARMPLYELLLNNLMKVQRGVKRYGKLEH